MKNPAQFAFNVAMVVAVAILFVLHFSRRPETPVRPVAAAPAAVENDAPAPSRPAEAPEPEPLTTGPEVSSADSGTLRRVAYVESGRLLEGYKGMQVARNAYEAKMARWEKQHAAAVSALQNAVQQYQAKAGGMLAGQRAEEEQKLQQQEQQVAQQQQQLQQQAQEEEAKLNEQVLGKVNKLLERYGKEQGYDLILIAGNGNVAYARKGLDITDTVLKRLNAEYAAGKK